MTQIKDILPDSQSLERALTRVLKSNLTDFLHSTHTRRQEVLGSIKVFGMVVVFFLAQATFLYLMEVRLDTLVGRVTLMSMMLWLLMVLLTGRDWFMNSRLLKKEMSMALVPILTNVLHRSFLYTSNESDLAQVTQTLQQSKLMTGGQPAVVRCDTYQVFDSNPVTFHKLEMAHEVPQQQGAEVFRGMLVIVELSRPVSAPTFVSTEGGGYGNKHLDFWSTVLDQTDIEETQLEWNDFEEDLHVATADPQAAREILTPEFVFDLHHWWLEHRLNIRLSFIGDRMYLLLPEQFIESAGGTTSTKMVAIKRYAWTILRPIWRSLMLIEDVPR